METGLPQHRGIIRIQLCNTVKAPLPSHPPTPNARNKALSPNSTQKAEATTHQAPSASPLPTTSRPTIRTEVLLDQLTARQAAEPNTIALASPRGQVADVATEGVVDGRAVAHRRGRGGEMMLPRCLGKEKN